MRWRRFWCERRGKEGRCESSTYIYMEVGIGTEGKEEGGGRRDGGELDAIVARSGCVCVVPVFFPLKKTTFRPQLQRQTFGFIFIFSCTYTPPPPPPPNQNPHACRRRPRRFFAWGH